METMDSVFLHKIPDVNPDLLRAPIGVKGALYGPRFAKSLIWAYFAKRNDIIDPPKLGEISLYRKDRDWKGGSTPDLLPHDQLVAFNDVPNKILMGPDW